MAPGQSEIWPSRWPGDGEPTPILSEFLMLAREPLAFSSGNPNVSVLDPTLRAATHRAADLSEPLLVVADLAGGEWPELARKAAIGLAAHAEENDPTSALLLDIRVLFLASGRDRLFSRTLVEGLNNRADRPWAELTPLRGATARQGHGQKITEPWLAKQLHPSGPGRFGSQERSPKDTWRRISGKHSSAMSLNLRWKRCWRK